MRDSNPRGGSSPPTRLAGGRTRPLCEPSAHDTHSTPQEISFRLNNTYANGSTTAIIPTRYTKSHTSSPVMLFVANARLRFTAGANGIKFDIACAHVGKPRTGRRCRRT